MGFNSFLHFYYSAGHCMYNISVFGQRERHSLPSAQFEGYYATEGHRNGVNSTGSTLRGKSIGIDG